jgi:hypothetical protein
MVERDATAGGGRVSRRRGPRLHHGQRVVGGRGLRDRGALGDAAGVALAQAQGPGARLIVINVTHKRARLFARQTCEMIEVRVPMPSGVATPAAMQPGLAFRQVVDAGREATWAALGSYATP